MAGDQIRIMCPSLTCRRVLAVPTTSRGKNVRCKGCGSTIRVPEKPVAQAAKDAAPATGATSPSAKAA